MRLEKNINKEIISWLNAKFSKWNLKNCKKYSKKNYWWNLGSERVNLVLRDFTFRWLEVHSNKSAYWMTKNGNLWFLFRLPFLVIQGHKLVLYLTGYLCFSQSSIFFHSIQLGDDKWLHFADMSLRLLPSKNYFLINMINK